MTIDQKRSSGVTLKKSDYENPDDCNVTIEIRLDCDALAIHPWFQYRARYACNPDGSVTVLLIADDVLIPNVAHRLFRWTPAGPTWGGPANQCAAFSTCDYVPEGDPTRDAKVVPLGGPRALATDHPQSAKAGSDFAGDVYLWSDPFFAGVFDGATWLERHDRFQAALPGGWYPDTCNQLLQTCSPRHRRGKMVPISAVSCGPPPTLTAHKCHEDEPCPDSRGLASDFVARFEIVTADETDLKLLASNSILGLLDIGTAKSPAEKKATGDDAWMRHEVSGLTFSPRCENRFTEGSVTEGKAHSDHPRLLSDIDSAGFEITRQAGSNEDTLTFGDLDFVLHGEHCIEGDEQTLFAASFSYGVGDLRCEPMMIAARARVTCAGDCPEARLRCPHTAFRFEFFRIRPDHIPPDAKPLLQSFACPEVAIVRARSMDPPTVWRNFVWIQDASCPFGIEQDSRYGVSIAGHVGVHLNPFKGKPGPSGGVEPNGLRMATTDPRDEASPSELTGGTRLAYGALWFAYVAPHLKLWTLTPSVRFSGILMRDPVDWRAGCRDASNGILVPASAASCEPPPVPQHEPRPDPYACQTPTKDTLDRVHDLANGRYRQVLPSIPRAQAYADPKTMKMLHDAVRHRGKTGRRIALALPGNNRCGRPIILSFTCIPRRDVSDGVEVEVLSSPIPCVLDADGRPAFLDKGADDTESFGPGLTTIRPPPP